MAQTGSNARTDESRREFLKRLNFDQMHFACEQALVLLDLGVKVCKLGFERFTRCLYDKGIR